MGARTYNYDHSLLLKDAGAVTSTAAAQVGGSNRILDMGAGRFDGLAFINVTAIDVSSSDERYLLTVQGSNSATFASGVENLATLDLGHSSTRAGGGQSSTIGQYELGVTNEAADVVYRYIRLHHTLSGTTPSINYTAFLTTEAGR